MLLQYLLTDLENGFIYKNDTNNFYFSTKITGITYNWVYDVVTNGECYYQLSTKEIDSGSCTPENIDSFTSFKNDFTSELNEIGITVDELYSLFKDIEANDEKYTILDYDEFENAYQSQPTSEPIENNQEQEVEKNEVNQTSSLPSVGEQNALNQAKSYLSFSNFSYSGLIEQLEYEGYTNEEATYAVDNCGADWNEQAAKQAESYMSFSSFSRSGLIDQLIYEGFTYEQAEYGVSAVGY